MARIEKTVFISYRRSDEGWALVVFNWLTQHGYDAFIDYDGLGSGAFGTAIIENIRARAHFLVLLTPTALDRCDEPGDWLRQEIEEAMAARRNIVPLMLSGFEFGAARQQARLTGLLAVLPEYNGLRVASTEFESTMQKLAFRFLNVPLDAVLHPASVHAMQFAKEQKDAATAAIDDDQLDFLRAELAEAKAKLKDFECPVCQAPLEVRVFHDKSGSYQGKEFDYEVEYVQFSCGCEMVDGTVTTKCKCPIE